MAVAELQGAAAVSRPLCKGPAERARSLLLATLAFAGCAAQARSTGGTDVQSGLVGMVQAAELQSRERRASKHAAAAAREPLSRVAVAAAPLMRSPDPAVAATTERLLACGDVENQARLEAALEAFGQAVRAATAPRPSW